MRAHLSFISILGKFLLVGRLLSTVSFNDSIIIFEEFIETSGVQEDVGE